MERQIAVYDNTISAREYLSYIAEQAGGFASMGRDGKLYIKTIGENITQLPLKYFQTYKWGEKFKISRVKYEDGAQLFERGDNIENTVYISQENMFIVEQKQIDEIYDKLVNLEIYSFEGDSIIDPALDVGDLLFIDNKYVIYQGSYEYKGKFKANILSKIQCKAKEEHMSKTPSIKNSIRRIESKIDQAEGTISSLIEVSDSLDNNIDGLDAELRKKLEDLNESLQDYQATIATQFKQTQVDYTFLFNTLVESINNDSQEANKKFAEITNYIRFVEGNIILGKSDSEIMLKIQSNKISFLQNKNEIAYISNNQLYITKGEFLESLQLGNFAFIPRTNGNLSFKKVGRE